MLDRPKNRPPFAPSPIRPLPGGVTGPLDKEVNDARSRADSMQAVGNISDLPRRNNVVTAQQKLQKVSEPSVFTNRTSADDETTEAAS